MADAAAPQGGKTVAAADEQTGGAAAPGTAAAGFDVAKGGWYTELSSMWPGMGMSLQVEEVVFRGRSDFQDVCVFKSKSFGTVLLLDGVIQCTDRDEFSYQEMITHLPLSALEAPPRRVLVVGGGDGGVLREVTRYASLESVDLAEIDGMVVDVSKRHFPALAAGFNDARVAVHICDGIKWVTDAAPGTYDAIIVDSSDPVGPAEVLFQRPFFEAMHAALAPGGVVCTQAESLWLHLPIISSLAEMCASVFAGGIVRYAYTTIPTYPSGQIGFMVCAKAKADGSAPRDPAVPARGPPAVGAGDAKGPLKYYNQALHAAAFTLPQFAVDALGGVGGGK